MTLGALFSWLAISTTVLALGHFYVWKRLVRDAELPKGWHRAVSALMAILLMMQPLVFAFARQLPRQEAAPWAFTAFTWMGVLSTLFSLLFLTDVVRLTCRLFRRTTRRTTANGEPTSPERRATLARMVSGGVALSGAGVAGVGVATALGKLRIEQVEVTLDKLPPAFDGFRIVQLSDIHVGPTIGREFIEHLVDVVSAEKADLVAITGDLVDGSVENLGYHTEPLSRLSSAHGTFFVTGNHEYYSGADAWVSELERLGLSVLRNRSVRVERGAESFVLAGVTDHRADRFGDAPDFAFALRDRRPEDEVVLLAHQPAAVYEAVRSDVGLQLSGHTHGGQFWPWNWVVHLVHPVVAGLARFGRTQIYVNRGTGYWGPPLRVGTEPEVTVVTLRAHV